MVFFTCNSCGESLKKNKVDKHLSQCRSESVSCVDCGRDFTYDYNSHNQCISEDQKYGGLDYKSKDNSTKGKAKQEEWVQKVNTAINESNCNNHIKDLLTRLSGYDNIPRKKQKFFNFVRSCLHVNNEYYTQQMWDVFENAIKTNPNNNGTNNPNKRDSNDSEVNQKNKRHKSDKSEDKEANEKMNGSENTAQNDGLQEVTEDLIKNSEQETNSESNPKLKIRKIIVQILKESQNNTLSLKKLKKRVIKKFKSMDDSFSKEDIESKFFSKLCKIKKIEMDEGMVSLKD